MKVLHTSDWHLGHTLGSFQREREHEEFLKWLLGVLAKERIDALLITGDIFDAPNPPASAQRMWYEFLKDANRQNPSLRVVAIGGNHDSATRLDAPDALLKTHNVHIVGGLPFCEDGTIDADGVLVPLQDSEGVTRAWCAAVPFLRACDLPPAPDATDPLRAGLEAVYHTVLEALKRRREPGQAALVTGHLYLTGTELSDLSERKVLGGNLHAVEASLFPEDLAYVALGHLHMEQMVGNRDNVRYAGSPFPLSVVEKDYDHQVRIVELDGEQAGLIRKLSIPRTVEYLRIPESGAANPEDIEMHIEALQDLDASVDPDLRPYLHIQVNRRPPDFAARVDRLLASKHPRLARLDVAEERRTGESLTLTDDVQLDELDEEEVFRLCYQQKFGEAPDTEILSAFRELVEEARRIQGEAE